KSTLMHCMAGLDDLTSGQVFLGDVDLGSLSDKDLTPLRRGRVGFVFLSFNLVPTLSALENITLPATLAGSKPGREWLDAYADSVLFLADGHLVDRMVDPAAKRVLDRLKSFGDEAVGADR